MVKLIHKSSLWWLRFLYTWVLCFFSHTLPEANHMTNGCKVSVSRNYDFRALLSSFQDFFLLEIIDPMIQPVKAIITIFNNATNKEPLELKKQIHGFFLLLCFICILVF